jgi:hypothetical protein
MRLFNHTKAEKTSNFPADVGVGTTERETNYSGQSKNMLSAVLRQTEVRVILKKPPILSRWFFKFSQSPRAPAIALSEVLMNNLASLSTDAQVNFSVFKTGGHKLTLHEQPMLVAYIKRQAPFARDPEKWLRGQKFFHFGIAKMKYLHQAIIDMGYYLWHGDVGSGIAKHDGQGGDEKRYNAIYQRVQKWFHWLRKEKWPGIQKEIRDCVTYRKSQVERTVQRIKNHNPLQWKRNMDEATEKILNAYYDLKAQLNRTPSIREIIKVTGSHNNTVQRVLREAFKQPIQSGSPSAEGPTIEHSDTFITDIFINGTIRPSAPVVEEVKSPAIVHERVLEGKNSHVVVNVENDGLDDYRGRGSDDDYRITPKRINSMVRKMADHFGIPLKGDSRDVKSPGSVAAVDIQRARSRSPEVSNVRLIDNALSSKERLKMAWESDTTQTADILALRANVTPEEAYYFIERYDDHKCRGAAMDKLFPAVDKRSLT